MYYFSLVTCLCKISTFVSIKIQENFKYIPRNWSFGFKIVVCLRNLKIKQSPYLVDKLGTVLKENYNKLHMAGLPIQTHTYLLKFPTVVLEIVPTVFPLKPL